MRPATAKLGPAQAQSAADAAIGAYMAQRSKQVIVTGFLPGSPGKTAGLKPGDAIVAVDGQPTAGLTLEQAVAKIKGAEGTQVHLKVRRKGAAGLLDFTITRRVIQIPETRTRMLHAGA